jgi:hypothetical protein
VDRDEVDDLDDPPTPVCYFIVGGNEDEYFAIEPLRHEIMVRFYKAKSGKLYPNKAHIFSKSIICNFLYLIGSDFRLIYI